MQRDTDRDLARIAEAGRRPDGSPDQPRAAPTFPADARAADAPRREPVTGPDRSVSFTVTTDVDGTVTAWSSFLDLDAEFIASAAMAARGAPTGSFRLDGSRWAYLVRPAPDGMRIAFLDISAPQAVLTRLVWTFAVAAAVMLVVITLASAFFVGRAIAPIREAFERQ